MNLFNCFQALALFTATPWAIVWLAQNSYGSIAILVGIAWALSYTSLAMVMHEGTK